MPSSLSPVPCRIRGTRRRRSASRRSLVLLGTLLLCGLAGPGGSAVHAEGTPTNTAAQTGNKGAQVYCYMRANGNGHEVSWAAAYALVKRQGSGPFKTSPEHAAVMITEAVVQNPNTYPDCGRYLGDLFNRRRVVYVPTGSTPATPSPSNGGASGTGSQSKW